MDIFAVVGIRIVIFSVIRRHISISAILLHFTEVSVCIADAAFSIGADQVRYISGTGVVEGTGLSVDRFVIK